MNEAAPVNFRKRPRISSNWLPSDWKTAPGSVAKSPATSGIKAYAQAATEITCGECGQWSSISCSCTSSSDVAERDHLYAGTTDPQQAELTGRLGEFVAFKYFVGKHGEPFVKWVNETNERGLPYDFVVGDGEFTIYIDHCWRT